MFWLLLATLLLTLAWHRAGLRTTTAAVASWLLAFGVFGESPALFATLLLVFAGVFVPLGIATLREEWLSRPLLDRVARTLLPRHRARLLAIDEGAADRHRLGEDAPAFTSAPPEAPDEIALQALLDRLLPVAGQPLSEVLGVLAGSRSFAPGVPLTYGGLEFDAGACSQLLRRLAANGGAALARAISQHQAAAQVLLAHAGKSQLGALLPRIADGSLRPVSALQSRWGGTATPDRGRVTRGPWKGRETLGVIVDFDKTLFDGTLGATTTDHACAHASDFLVGVVIDDPDGLLPDAIDGSAASSGAAVPRGGDSVIRVPATLAGLQPRFDDDVRSCARIHAEALFLPLDYIVGGAAGIGAGARAQTLAQTALAAGELAIAHGLAVRALAHASLRARIDDFHRLPPRTAAQREQRLADAAVDTLGLQLLGTLLDRELDAGGGSRLIAALAVHVGATLADAVQARLGETVQANCSVAPSPDLNLAAWSLSPQLRALLDAAALQPYGAALARFDAQVWPLFGEVAAHAARALLLGVSDGHLQGRVDGGRWAQRLMRYRAALALGADAQVLTRHPPPPGGVAERALLEALAQTLALAAGVYARTAPLLPRDALPLLGAWSGRCARRLEDALADFAAAQPTLPRRALLHGLLLPLGRWRRRPQDAPVARLAGLLQARGPVRDHVLQAYDASARERELLAALDAAATPQLRLRLAADENRLAPARPAAQLDQAAGLGLVDAGEVERLRRAYALAEAWRLGTPDP